MTIILGIFFLLHAMVHLLYAGQSVRRFELRLGMTWPDGSLLCSRQFGNETTRLLAAILLALATLGFAAGGLGLFLQQAWWRSIVAGAAVLSCAIFLLFWNGKYKALSDQGWIGILINLAILGIVLLFKWPA